MKNQKGAENMQEKRIGKRLVLLSWDRYQQLIAAGKELQEENKNFNRWAIDLLEEYRAKHAQGTVQK